MVTKTPLTRGSAEKVITWAQGQALCAEQLKVFLESIKLDPVPDTRAMPLIEVEKGDGSKGGPPPGSSKYRASLIEIKTSALGSVRGALLVRFVQFDGVEDLSWPFNERFWFSIEDDTLTLSEDREGTTNWIKVKFLTHP
jgi:hypothetical protein